MIEIWNAPCQRRAYIIIESWELIFAKYDPNDEIRQNNDETKRWKDEIKMKWWNKVEI